MLCRAGVRSARTLVTQMHVHMEQGGYCTHMGASCIACQSCPVDPGLGYILFRLMSVMCHRRPTLTFVLDHLPGPPCRVLGMQLFDDDLQLPIHACDSGSGPGGRHNLGSEGKVIAAMRIRETAVLCELTKRSRGETRPADRTASVSSRAPHDLRDAASAEVMPAGHCICATQIRLFAARMRGCKYDT